MTTLLSQDADLKGSFSFLHPDRKQTQLAENIFAVLANCEHGLAQLYFVNAIGEEIDIPSEFSLRIIITNDIFSNVDPIRPGSKFFVLSWSNSYVFVYQAYTCKLLNQKQWTLSGDLHWDA